MVWPFTLTIVSADNSFIFLFLVCRIVNSGAVLDSVKVSIGGLCSLL